MNSPNWMTINMGQIASSSQHRRGGDLELNSPAVKVEFICFSIQNS